VLVFAPRRGSLFSAVVVASILTACKPSTPVPILKAPDGSTIEAPAAPQAQEEDAARALLEEARALAARGDQGAARAKEDQVLGGFPATAAAAEIFAERGRAAEDAGDTDGAIANYEKLLFYRPSFPQGDRIRERYAALLMLVDRYSDAASMLQALYESRRETPEKLRIGVLLIDALSAADRARPALEVATEVYDASASRPELRAELDSKTINLLQNKLSFQATESLWSDVKRDARWRYLQPAIAFRLGKIYYHTRSYERSEEMLELVASRYPESRYAPPARDFLGRLKARFVVDPNAVGVILPLSGRYQLFGQRSLEAIRLGIGNGTSIRLVVKDTEADPVKASQAVEDLVLKDHVVAIIGPLFPSEALAAALKAEEFAVPLVSLSYAEGIPELGPSVFRTALTIRAQARALAKVAFDSLGYRSFALLYPRSRYGSEFVEAFWDEVDKRHGEIRGAESYERDQTTFQEPVRKLVGRWYTLARYDYRRAMDELRGQRLPPHVLRMKVNKLDKELAPVVDFDAIVIPDGSKSIGLIAPALAFEDIVMTHDPKMLEKIKKATGRDNIRPVTLLGASTWNSPQTVESCERYCEESVFVDAFNADSPDAKVRDFVTAFRNAASVEPHLTDAQAFDTAGIVRAVLQRSGPRTRPAFASGLRGMAPFDGVTGKLSFDAQGDTTRDLVVLTIRDGLIRPWLPESEPPRG